VEADATITLGSVSAYLEPDEPSLAALRAGVALALDLDIPITAVRGYINLSDVLEMLGAHEEAATAAGEGLDLAARSGLARTLGSYLIGNQAEPLLRLGRWAEADELTAQALAALPEGVFAATLRQVRAELAVLRGRYDEGEAEMQAARRYLIDISEFQFALPVHYTTALIALGRGHPQAARAAVAAALAQRLPQESARYAWPLLWLGLRVEADDAVRARDRRQAVPDTVTRRVTELTALAGVLAGPPPAARGYRALAAAERARAEGAGETAAWTAAVAAWRPAAEPHPLAYALLRLAEAHTAAGERAAAGPAVAEAHALAERIGAEPVAAEAAALARRARLSLGGPADDGAAAPAPRAAPADELARFGLTDREREVLLLLAAGRSNPEIARELYISAKTASVHVSNILAKLGVSGRVEAAAVVHRLGAGSP
jgi:DNA-binding CsgD family transcriptional regulator